MRVSDWRSQLRPHTVGLVWWRYRFGFGTAAISETAFSILEDANFDWPHPTGTTRAGVHIAGEVVFNMPFVSAPAFYVDLHEFVGKAGKDLAKVNASGYAFELTKSGHCIDTRHLSQAASKFLLAERVQGLSLDGYAAGSETPEHYSAQVKMALSVVAFESYCRLFGKKWHQVYFDIISVDVAERYNKSFSEISLAANFFGRLKSAQDDKLGGNLVSKIEEFETGESRNLYSIAVGFRNAFSHGRLGALAGTAEVGECLRSFVLDAIREDCERRYVELIF